MADISKFTANSGITVYDFKDAKARDIIAPEFSSETSYSVGDYCIYDGILYKCNTAHIGTWVANDFTATTGG
jgi:hypothetical protein